MKAELCCAGLSTAAASRASSCRRSLSQTRRFSTGAALSVRGWVRCHWGSRAPRKLLHGSPSLSPDTWQDHKLACKCWELLAEDL